MPTRSMTIPCSVPAIVSILKCLNVFSSSMLGKLMRRLEVTVCLGTVYVWLYTIIFAINTISLTASGIGCRWQGFGNGGSCRGDLCEQKPRPAPCWTQAVPAGSKIASLQDTAEPVRRVCGVSGRKHLRNGKKHYTAVKQREVWETVQQTPRVEKEEEVL